MHPKIFDTFINIVLSMLIGTNIGIATGLDGVGMLNLGAAVFCFSILMKREEF